MKKEDLIRLKALLSSTIIVSSLALSSCGGNYSKFDYDITEEGNFIVSEDSIINSIGSLYVVKVNNLLTNEEETLICRRKEIYRDHTSEYKYYDVLYNNRLIIDTENETFFELLSEEPLSNYIAALGLEKAEYSYEDIANLLDIIKENINVNDNTKKLIK